MEEEMGTQGSRGNPDTTETADAVDSRTSEPRRGRCWKGWVFSILVAVALSVTATLLLGGFGAFRSDRAVASGEAAGGCGSGAGKGCCPPADAGK